MPSTVTSSSVSRVGYLFGGGCDDWRWDGMGWDGMRWDGMDGMGWVGMGLDGMGWGDRVEMGWVDSTVMVVVYDRIARLYFELRWNGRVGEVGLEGWIVHVCICLVCKVR